MTIDNFFQIYGLFYRDQVDSFHSLRPWLYPLLHLCGCLWTTQACTRSSGSKQSWSLNGLWSIVCYGRLWLTQINRKDPSSLTVYVWLKCVQDHLKENKTDLWMGCRLWFAMDIYDWLKLIKKILRVWQSMSDLSVFKIIHKKTKLIFEWVALYFLLLTSMTDSSK